MTNINDRRARNDVARHLILVLAPWFLIWLLVHADVDNRLLRLVFAEPPLQFVIRSITIGPILLMLALGLLWAWKKGFHIWVYPWIGMLFFFAYREVFDMVIQFSRDLSSTQGEFLMHVFYFGVVPSALAALLVWITRTDWLMACFTVYPYTSLLMPWYTLDTTPVAVLLVSLALYALSIYIFLVAQERNYKFAVLVIGTLVIGGGFFLWLGEPQALVICTLRNMLIILFPPIVASIPLCRRLFRIQPT